MRRGLVRVLREHLRRTDISGELGTGELLIAFPGCDRRTVTVRICALEDAFMELISHDAQLSGLRIVTGVADSELGLVGLAWRAERELRARRAA